MVRIALQMHAHCAGALDAADPRNSQRLVRGPVGKPGSGS
jgi:hypothetical protein